jgi:hypothetical protein
MRPGEPDFETIGGFRYALWDSLVVPYRELVSFTWLELLIVLSSTVVTWVLMMDLIIATALGRISFELGIASLAAVAVVGHVLHPVLARRRVQSERRARMLGWLASDSAVSGVPCRITLISDGIRMATPGIASIEGSRFELSSPCFRAVLHPRDLIPSNSRRALVFEDKQFKRRFIVKLGGYGREGFVKGAKAAAALEADLEAWRNRYSSEPSVFPPIRRRCVLWPLRTLAVNIPLGLLATYGSFLLLCWVRSVLLWVLPDQAGPTDYMAMFAILFGSYGVALLAGWISIRRAHEFNARIDRMIAGELRAPIEYDQRNGRAAESSVILH